MEPLKGLQFLVDSLANNNMGHILVHLIESCRPAETDDLVQLVHFGRSESAEEYLKSNGIRLFPSTLGYKIPNLLTLQPSRKEPDLFAFVIVKFFTQSL